MKGKLPSPKGIFLKKMLQKSEWCDRKNRALRGMSRHTVSVAINGIEKQQNMMNIGKKQLIFAM